VTNRHYTRQHRDKSPSSHPRASSKPFARQPVGNRSGTQSHHEAKSKPDGWEESSCAPRVLLVCSSCAPRVLLVCFSCAPRVLLECPPHIPRVYVWVWKHCCLPHSAVFTWPFGRGKNGPRI
jgi:hypothetical protein